MEYELESSDDNDCSSSSDTFSSDSSNSSKSELDYESESESYNPDGVESEDDEAGCCHWSTEPDVANQNALQPELYLEEYGRPQTIFGDDTKPHTIIESIMDEEFIKMCIDATNEHGFSDQRYQEKIGVVGKD